MEDSARIAHGRGRVNERYPYLTQVFIVGLLASLLAGIVLSTSITLIYRKSVMEAEDRLSLARVSDILANAVAPIASTPGGRHGTMMANLAMVVSHVEMLVPTVKGVNIMWPNGTQIFGSGGGHSTQSVPLRDHNGHFIAMIGLNVVDGDIVDASTLKFVISIALAALVVVVAPQFALARRAIGVLSAQRTAAEDAYVATLVSLSNSLELRDRYTAGHSKRVAGYAEIVARQLRLSVDEIRVVREGALLHDLGKVAVPDAVLLKDGPLEEHERKVIERHPVAGSEVLAVHERLDDVRVCVLHHHERLDGAGYPKGLSGTAIPLSARIVAVADSYDAMTTDRPYRKALSHEVAVSRLRSGTGTQWDGNCVEAFIAAFTARNSEPKADRVA